MLKKLLQIPLKLPYLITAGGIGDSIGNEHCRLNYRHTKKFKILCVNDKRFRI